MYFNLKQFILKFDFFFNLKLYNTKNVVLNDEESAAAARCSLFLF